MPQLNSIQEHPTDNSKVTETRIISSLSLQYLDTLSVLVSDINTELKGILKAEAATWATFVCKPWPISTPPCVTKTVPSV
jgi:hypothetical protein